MKLKDKLSRDGKVKKYTNKIYRDNHIHYYHTPVDGDPLVLVLSFKSSMHITWEKFILSSIIYICSYRGWGGGNQL